MYYSSQEPRGQFAFLRFWDLIYEHIKVDKLFMNIYFYKERSFLISSCFLYLMSPKY